MTGCSSRLAEPSRHGAAQLERHGPAELAVLHLVHVAHAAAADGANETVAGPFEVGLAGDGAQVVEHAVADPPHARSAPNSRRASRS
jgi:hypothetical protein